MSKIVYLHVSFGFVKYNIDLIFIALSNLSWKV